MELDILNLKITMECFVMTEISIIIPVYHALEYLKDALNSLQQMNDLSLAEIILVNDCPGSETADFMHQYAASYPVRVVDNPQNMGFIHSCNRGMAVAQSPIVVLLNSDTIVPKTLVRKFLDCFNSNANIACAAPLGSSREKSVFPSDVNAADELAEEKAGNEPYLPTLVPNGFCFGIRKCVVEKIGGFDPVFGKGYCEENDFSFRALKAGYQNVAMVNTFVVHKGSASFGSEETRRRIKHNKQILDARWHEYMHEYKKSCGKLYKGRHYVKRFRPWYQNMILFMRRKLLQIYLLVLPEGPHKDMIRYLK